MEFRKKTLRFDASAALHERAINCLNAALHEQPKFIKVHAAENLLSLGSGSAVRCVFERECEQFGDQPHHRIGIWRVLAGAASSAAERAHYVGLLRSALFDQGSPDQTAAAESLAKLGQPISPSQRSAFEQVVASLAPAALPFGYWLTAISGSSSDLLRLADLLGAEQPLIRVRTAYALRHLRNRLPPAVVAQIATSALHEPEGGSRGYLFSAAYVTATDAAQVAHFKDALKHSSLAGSKDERYELAAALAIRGDLDDLTQLTTLLNDCDPDVQVSAAHAIVSIDRRQQSTAEPRHWVANVQQSI